jgi:hypothetical protein
VQVATNLVDWQPQDVRSAPTMLVQQRLDVLFMVPDVGPTDGGTLVSMRVGGAPTLCDVRDVALGGGEALAGDEVSAELWLAEAALARAAAAVDGVHRAMAARHHGRVELVPTDEGEGRGRFRAAVLGLLEGLAVLPVGSTFRILAQLLVKVKPVGHIGVAILPRFVCHVGIDQHIVALGRSDATIG